MILTLLVTPVLYLRFGAQVAEPAPITTASAAAV
jgi:hypothetical protein